MIMLHSLRPSCCIGLAPVRRHASSCPRMLHRVNGWYEGPSERRAARKPRTDRGPYQANFPRHPSQKDTEDGRDGLGDDNGREETAQESQLDGFVALSARLRAGNEQGFVINKEAWSKLFSMIRSPEDAHAAMELMLSDSAVRDSVDWDWQTQGYGQIVFQLVQACAAVRVYSVCDWVIEHSGVLNMTVGSDTVPNMLRKVAASGADLLELQRLYQLEKNTRGKNSNAGFYELFKVLKRAGDGEGIKCLMTEAKADRVKLKDSLSEEVEAWLRKQGF